MKRQAKLTTIYEAEEGKIFDYADLKPHTHIDEEGNTHIEHLYVKRLVIEEPDSIDNYVELAVIPVAE
jgi:hypothetical protein